MSEAQKKKRDKLLDELKQAADEWYQAETSRIEDETEFMKSFMRGRTGSDRLADKNTQQMGILAVDDIRTFLTGGD